MLNCHRCIAHDRRGHGRSSQPWNDNDMDTYANDLSFSETDFTDDLRSFDVPTLIVHGDDDQIVPIGAAALRSTKLVKNAALKVYAGAPHGLTDTRTKRGSTPICWHFSRREIALPHLSLLAKSGVLDDPGEARRPATAAG